MTGRAHNTLATCVLAVLFAAAPGASALAQKLGQGGDDDISIWRVVAALLLCMVLAVAGAYVLKSGAVRGLPTFSLAKRARRLQLVESLRIGSQVDLCIVTCDGRELLVASSAHGADLLAHLPLAETIVAPLKERP